MLTHTVEDVSTCPAFSALSLPLDSDPTEFCLQLHFGWMSRQAGLPDYVVESMAKDDMRILLEGSGYRMWFLGERVIGQCSAAAREIVP